MQADPTPRSTFDVDSRRRQNEKKKVGCKLCKRQGGALSQFATQLLRDR